MNKKIGANIEKRIINRQEDKKRCGKKAICEICGYKTKMQTKHYKNFSELSELSELSTQSKTIIEIAFN